MTIGSEESSNKILGDIDSMDTGDWLQEENLFNDPF